MLTGKVQRVLNSARGAARRAPRKRSAPWFVAKGVARATSEHINMMIINYLKLYCGSRCRTSSSFQGCSDASSAASYLAALYGVAPKVLLQSVKRNRKRLPADLMMQLTAAEWKAYRQPSNIRTSAIQFLCLRARRDAWSSSPKSADCSRNRDESKFSNVFTLTTAYK